MLNRRNLLFAAAMAPLAGGSAIGAAAAHAIAVSTRIIDVKGRAAKVFALTVDGKLGGLETVAGETLRMTLENRLDAETLVHWHGLTPPSDQDGVPNLSQPPLAPGAAYTYDFLNTRSGTHWMHSHVGLQEQRLLAAPLIVRRREELDADVQEHVVMLHDFTFRDPAEILAELKSGEGEHAGHSGMDHSTMSMDGPAMLNDVAFDAWLANERTLEDPEVVRAAAGGRLRLRIINAAAASNMWIDLGSLEGDLIAVDGNGIVPVRGRRFPLAIAQRADILIEMPKAGGAFPVLFLPEGTAARTGLVLATAGAPIAGIAETGEAIAPAVDLSLEAQLVALTPPGEADGLRSEMLHLGGGGADYVWTLNGKSGMHDTLLTAKPGERLEIALMNMTTMAHPMHLHGHHFHIAGLGGRRISGALRDTILVPPMQTVTIAFDADNPGTWALHCHHLYHMNSGMMGALAYVSAA